MSKYNPEFEEGVDSESDQEVEEPHQYKVMLLNDDYTTMEFVIEVLVHVFQCHPDYAQCTSQGSRHLRYLSL
jgi:ATP-dependent Clp protease adapter protein ClpS